MNRKLLSWGIALSVFALNLPAALGQSYDFAVVSNNAAAGFNLSAVANNGNTFVCVGAANSPTFAANANNFSSFANSNVNGGYLLFSNAWANSLNSKIKYNWLSCIATQQVGFIASGASNAVFVSADGINWTNLVHVNPSDSAIVIGGIAYNPIAGTLADAEENNSESYTLNPTNGWLTSPLAGGSLVETFLAVASSSGSSNMALCGILGDIRYSTTAGKSWAISQQVNSAMPNLTGIAYDGGSNLVCVGASSVIEVGTNGGFSSANWTFQNKIIIGTSASPTNFNAVAYSSATSNFLAAGTIAGNGLIVMATNSAPAAQWTWLRQTNIWAFQNGQFSRVTPTLAALNGSSFANSGFFQGIGMVVGNNGTILIAGLPPLAPTNSFGNDITNILSSPQTNALVGSVNDIVPDSNQPTNEFGLDWYSQKVGGTELATNSSAFLPPASLYNTCGVYTVWAQERDLRTGFINTNRTAFNFTIVPGVPTDLVSVTNCDPVGQNFGMCPPTPMSVTVVTNAANPPGTIRVNWYDSGLNLVDGNTFSPNSGIVPYTPSVPGPGAYIFYAQATNPASGFASALVPVTFQVNVLPQWTSSAPIATNVIMTSPQVNPVIQIPSLANGAYITNVFELGSVITYDWYTNLDPTISTYPNQNFAYGESGLATGNNSFIPTNRVCGTYKYYVRARAVYPGFTACECQSTNLITATFNVIPDAPTNASVGLTNVLNTANMPIWVDAAVNADNPVFSFKVNWYAASNDVININDLNDISIGNRFFHTPTNTACGVYTNWAEVRVATAPTLVSPSRIPVVFAIIPAAPSAVGSLNATNCTEVPNPTFTVTVANNQTAAWFASGGTLATNALSFAPTDSSPGTFTYSALAVDTNSGLFSTDSVTANLTLSNCTSPLTINIDPASGTGTIQWPGDLVLLSSSNLVDWTIVSTGSVFVAPNTLSWTNTSPPIQFFRLTN